MPSPKRTATTPGYPAPVDRLVSEFANLPGIGRRTAERLAFHVLKSAPAEALKLADAIRDVKKSVRHCSICFNFTDDRVCAICADPRRDASSVLVVEQPKDLLAIEFSGMYRGTYHVLMGRISPLEGIGPEDLTTAELLRRVDDPSQNSRGVLISEVILGMNPTLEGDGTALHLAEVLGARNVRVTRLARGLAAGASLDTTNKAVLADALEGRRPVLGA